MHPLAQLLSIDYAKPHGGSSTMHRTPIVAIAGRCIVIPLSVMNHRNFSAEYSVDEYNETLSCILSAHFWFILWHAFRVIYLPDAISATYRLEGNAVLSYLRPYSSFDDESMAIFTPAGISIA